MKLLYRASIQTKLMLSMGLCLLLIVLISASVSVWLASRNMRERAIDVELPSVVNQLRSDILRQIAPPLAASRAIADNTFLLDWEREGLPDAGLAKWQRYAAHAKALSNAADVFWVSGATGRYFTPEGQKRQLAKANAGDQWFYGFLSSGAPYSLDLDRDTDKGSYMLFINVRFEAAPGQLGVAGLALPADELARSVSAMRHGQSGVVYLVRENGNVLVHQDSGVVDGKHFLKDLPGIGAANSEALLAHKAFAYARYDAPDGARIVASTYVPELKIYAIAEVSEAEIIGGAVRSAGMAALISGALGGLIGLGLIYVISRRMAAPVRRAAKLLGEIADGNGDLTRRMWVESGDEIGALGAAFNRFVASLEGIVGNVRQGANSISQASSEVASGNQDLSRRTEQAASALQQTAASTQRLAESVHGNAQASAQAGRLALQARDDATRGGTAVADVIETMHAIDASSHKIADIIAVIDGIAFQTNILALYAAVEAARAGEQGRGFAVVASEVRALAQRSAAAAKEIRVLITASVDQVKSGSTRVQSAGTTMNELVASVAKVTRIIEEIGASVTLQSQGLVEINQAVGHVDAATQQNTALVEQSAAAAESLSEQAQRLLGLVGAFKVAEVA